MIKVGINGFGRIGRMVFRAAMQRTDIQVVAVNDLLELPHLAYLLRHDSVHGRFPHQVSAGDNALLVDGRSVRATRGRCDRPGSHRSSDPPRSRGR